MFGLIFFGFRAFQKMGVNENPDVDYPTITVSYTYDGATPAVIEKDILEPVESVLVSIAGIRNMTSTANRGSGQIRLEFELHLNVDFALQEVQTLLGRAQRQLPDSLDPPTVTKSNAADDPLMNLSLSSAKLSVREMMLLFRDRIRDQLSTIEGVAEIRAYGYQEPLLRVDLIADRLKQFDLTATDITDSIRRGHNELPAGKFESGDEEDLIRIMGEVSTVEQFQNLVISRRGGSPNYLPLRLKDVANVYEGVENTTRISRVNGVPSLTMAVQKQRGVNAVAIADSVIERVAEINASLPEGTTLSMTFDRTKFVRESVNELLFTLILSAVLTSIVCWLFIGSWSVTTNILLAIPVAIIGTFLFISWLGFTLNTFTILGLALAIGIVVDDAIVMLENIIRYMQNGYDRVNAAFKGAREISFAVIATSVALISLFIPISFMEGIEGRFFFEFAVTLSIAVALSSVESLTLAPMRCSQFLTVTPRTTWLGRNFEAAMNGLRSYYEKTLKWALGHRISITVFSTMVFISSMGLFNVIPSEFAPEQDRGALFLVFSAPDGKSMKYTDEKVKEFEAIALAHPAVEKMMVAVGGFGGGGQGNRGNGVLVLKERSERSQNSFEVATQLRNEARKSIKGMQVFVRDRFGSSIGGRRGSPVEFTVNGPDPAEQRVLLSALLEKMEADPQIVDARSDDVRTLPEVHVVPDRSRALASGVEIEEIAGIVNTALGGVVAGQYTQGGSRFNIFVQLQEKDRQSRNDITRLLVRNNRGQPLPMNLVVEAKTSEGPQAIFREDRVRGLRVDASLAEGASLGPVTQKIEKWAKELFPSNYYVRFSSTPQEKIHESVIIIGLGLIIAYMILASQFNSFIDPLIVFLAIPFGLTGSLIALAVGEQTLNIYSVIGLLLTMGIVKKNSILLVEFTNHLRDQGRETNAALYEACTIRLRPILMTNLATLAAAIPPALAIGPGNETRIPMALTIIGGVIVSVLFTLYVVPCVYSLINPKRRIILEENALADQVREYEGKEAAH